MSTPRIEINLRKIAHNLKILTDLYDERNITICAVTKVVCGDLEIAQLLIDGGIQTIADSKIDNLLKFHRNNLKCQLVHLGPPKMSETDAIINCTDISLNTEISVIKQLSESAIEHDTIHKIILMVEYGDLREGIMPEDLEEIIKQVLLLKGIKLTGIGTNLACFGGVEPDQCKMKLLSDKADSIEKEFGIHLTYISGGNSANYKWYTHSWDVSRVNQLRLGESIFLGIETLQKLPIPNLFLDAFTLVTEVTELKTKPSKPYGTIGLNAFGEKTVRQDSGKSERAIIGIGRQDINIAGLTPEMDVSILGGSSDHMIIDPKKSGLRVGSEVRFNLNYSALLTGMTSPYVSKTKTYN